jgi:23S rRNA (guanosine2251-2'-O)-methyltransferase
MALKTFALYDRGKIELINFNKIIILDDITDPHNVGAIIRSAKAFGFDAVVCEDKHSPAESATISKTSAGIIDVMPYVRLPSLFNEVTALKNAGFQIYGLDKGGEEIATHQKNNGAKIALVVGSEGKGLSPHIKRLCDKILSIKISDEVESLNASVACAVAMHSL